MTIRPHVLPRLIGLGIMVVLALGSVTGLAQESTADADTSPNTDKTRLMWSLSEGDRLDLAITQKTSIDTTAERRLVTQSHNLTLSVAWRVASVDDQGTATIEQTIRRIQAELVLPSGEGTMATFTYDSEGDKPRGDNRLLADSLSRLLDVPVTITMTGHGAITDVAIPDESMESLRQMPGSIEGREVFSLESIREMFQSCGTELPQSELAPGESWTSTRPFQVGSPHQFQRVTTYTLTDPETVVFQAELKLESVGSPDANSQIEFETWVIDDQKSKGTIRFPRGSRWPTKSDSTTEISTRTHYQGFRVSSTVRSELQVTIVESETE